MELASTLPIIADHAAPDGTSRLVFELEDGRRVEAVWMPDGHRPSASLCISTQVGCPVGCVFCASGRQGLSRNLTTGEMLAQVESVRQHRRRGEELERIVFMGMGEPLLNAPAVARTVVALQQRYGMGRKKITVSTVGIIKGLRPLLVVPYPPALAVSLHAPDDACRSELVPFRGAAPVGALMAAVDDYSERARLRVVIQYTLIDGVNDDTERARRLRDLCLGRRVKINLIPWNPIPGVDFGRPSQERMDAFAEVLYLSGLHVTRRQTRGRAIDAACGQLAQRRS